MNIENDDCLNKGSLIEMNDSWTPNTPQIINATSSKQLILGTTTITPLTTTRTITLPDAGGATSFIGTNSLSGIYASGTHNIHIGVQKGYDEIQHNHPMSHSHNIVIGGRCFLCLINRIESIENMSIQGYLIDFMPKELINIIKEYTKD
jgi:hypothetical protein